MISISVAGTTVGYTTAGTGPKLVLLHGSGNDGQGSFGHILSCFTDVRTVVVADYAGCGHSTIPEGNLSLDLLVEQAAAVIRDLGAEPVDLLGSSMGAQVAAATAAVYPSLINRLVLVGGRADSQDARHQMVFDTWARLEAIDPRLSDRYLLLLVYRPEFLSALSSDRLHQLLHRPLPAQMKKRIEFGLRSNIRKQLIQITAPTLVVGMTRDCLVPVYHARELQKLIPNSQYAEIDSGHSVFREEPEKITHLIRNFILTSPSHGDNVYP